MPSYYDDNYGHYEVEPGDEEATHEFYKETQKNSVWKKCQRCRRRVKILRSYSICNSCADAAERGLDY